MRTLRITFSIFIAFSLFLVYESAESNIINPPVARTGAPAEETCTNLNCHSGPEGNQMSYSFGMSDSNYIPGATYTISVTVTDLSQGGTGNFGFEMTALQSTDIGAGSFASTSSATWDTTAYNRPYIAHNNATSNNTWTFEWNAPSTNVGDIDFYLTGNAGNNNGKFTGDNIHKTSFTIQPRWGVGLNDEQDRTPKLWVSYSSQLMVHYQLPIRTRV